MTHATMDHKFNNSKWKSSLSKASFFHPSLVSLGKSQASWNRHTVFMSKKLKLSNF